MRMWLLTTSRNHKNTYARRVQHYMYDKKNGESVVCAGKAKRDAT